MQFLFSDAGACFVDQNTFVCVTEKIKLSLNLGFHNGTEGDQLHKAIAYRRKKLITTLILSPQIILEVSWVSSLTRNTELIELVYFMGSLM